MSNYQGGSVGSSHLVKDVRRCTAVTCHGRPDPARAIVMSRVLSRAATQQRFYLYRRPVTTS
jgi:hypothetical protein